MILRTILVELSIYTTYLAAFLGLLFFRKLKGEIKILVFLVFFKVFSEIVTSALSANGIRNLFVTHIYAPIELIFLALMFAEATKTYISKKIYYYSILIFLIFSVINVIFFESINNFNSLGRTLQSVFVIGFCFIYFFQLLDQLQVKYVQELPFFWVTCALMLYFAGSLFSSLLFNVKSTSQFFTIVSRFFSFFNTLVNLSFCLAIWMASKQMEEKEEEYLVE